MAESIQNITPEWMKQPLTRLPVGTQTIVSETLSSLDASEKLRAAWGRAYRIDTHHFTVVDICDRMKMGSRFLFEFLAFRSPRSISSLVDTLDALPLTAQNLRGIRNTVVAS